MIGLMIGNEMARGTPKTDGPSKAACCNDDSLNLRMTVDIDGGGRNRETGGLVEREATVGVQEPINASAVPTILEGTSGRNFQAGYLEAPNSIHRLLDGATSDVVGRPTSGEVKKTDGLGSKPNIPVDRQESDGPMNVEGGRSLKVRPKAALLSHGSACSHNNGQSIPRSVGFSLSSGSSAIKRPEAGSESKVRDSHPKVRWISLRICDFFVGFWVGAKAVKVFVCAANGASVCGSRFRLLCRWVEADNGGWLCHFVVSTTGVLVMVWKGCGELRFLGFVLPEILPKPTLEDGALLWGEFCLNSFFAGALLSVLNLGGNVLRLWLWLLLNGGRFS
ncbi:hypothetical protein Ancab_010514 [Ancistrocladus abbreviatus]